VTLEQAREECGGRPREIEISIAETAGIFTHFLLVLDLDCILASIVFPQYFILMALLNKGRMYERLSSRSLFFSMQVSNLRADQAYL
jgi:hypothetical protein